MKKYEIINNGNELIGEFTGFELTDKSDSFHEKYYRLPREYSMFMHCSHWHELKFHRDWEWLMRACRKWDRLDIPKKESIVPYRVSDRNIFISHKRQEYEDLCDDLDNLVSCYEKEPVFKQLVKNIKWYNKKIKK